MSPTLRSALAGSALALACSLAASDAPAQLGPLVLRARDATTRLDVAEAHRLLAPLPQDSPDVVVERALLAIYEDDCDGALALLRRHGLENNPHGRDLSELVRGCARATASTTVLRADDRGYILRFKNDEDAVLAPFLMDVADRALAALERDLKEALPRPVRIDVVPDHYSLAAMTGLPEEAAQTTGTVAIAKWGRVTMLSPSAMAHGYGWADTLMHELTHLTVTRASHDRAPLWLQEGVAKRQETRWRSPFPFDNQPPPEAVARLGFDRGIGLPLDKLGPSIAMLPTAEQAMVAFAEVHSFLRFWTHERGDEALGRFLHALADAPLEDPIDTTLRQQTGAPLAEWSDRWRRSLASVNTSLPPDLMPPLPPAKDGKEGKESKEAKDGPASPRALYRSARLAELLAERGHAQQAAGYARKTQEAAPSDASARARLAVLLRATGHAAEADALVASLDPVRSAHGLYLTLHADAQRRQADESAANQAFFQALCQDPLNAEVACELLGPTDLPADPSRAALCRLARRR